jgi:hypothetical protein
VAEAELARLLIFTHRVGFWASKTEIAELPAAADRPLALHARRPLSASVRPRRSSIRGENALSIRSFVAVANTGFILLLPVGTAADAAELK